MLDVRQRRIPILAAVLACLAVMLMTAGCQGRFPADSQDTLDRVSGGVLRVGVSENEPFTAVAPDGSVSGSEADLVEKYAATIEADVQWIPGGESTLAASMKEGDLDLVIGGFPSDAPWTSDIAFTRPYTTTMGPDGSEVKIVMGVTPGENALQIDLERFLAEEAGEL